MPSKFALFTKGFLRKPRLTGAIAASSKYLAQKMIAPIDFERAEVIVELGPGDGPFTREILKYKKPETKLILIEKNEDLIPILHQKYPETTIIYDDAKNLGRILEEHGIQKVDYVVSGLPFAAFPKDLTLAIFAQIKQVLKENGLFITFQYTRFLQKLFTQHFTIRQRAFTFWNIPPAFVYKMGKKSTN